MLLGATVLIAPSHAQTPLAATQNGVTVREFRQAVVDLGAYLDARKGTDLRRPFETASEDVLMALFPSVADPRRFLDAVAALKRSASDPVSRGPARQRSRLA